MTHNEVRSTWIREFSIGMGVGILYGTTNVSVGHPFDTLKTKMQAQKGFENVSMLQVAMKTLKNEGIVGLYRGCVPLLWGSGLYRSTQFAVFEGIYTLMDSPNGCYELPGTGKLQLRVILAGICAASARAVIETPLEYAKIRRQTGQTWHFRQLYTGFGVTWARTLGLMTTYFILIDSGRRHFSTQFQQSIWGPFLTSGVSATLAWWIVWPLEVIKSQAQSNYGSPQSTWSRLKWVYHERGGFRGLYRGILPGSIRSFIANGVSMVVMIRAQKMVSRAGLRS